MAQRAPFPNDPDEFAQDNRISYSKPMQTFVLEDEDGEEWEWLPGPAKWSMTMDEALTKQQAEIYKIAGVDDDAPALNPAKKRKEAHLEDPETNPKNTGAKAKATATAAASKPRQNTAVFITGLPLDTDKDEVKVFFKKFGLISESIDDDEKRIKLYTDKDGNFKGEALVVYHRVESVQISIDMADQATFYSQNNTTGVISVMAADTSFKVHKEDDDNPAVEERPKAKVKAMSKSTSRVKGKKKAEEMNSRLGDWSDDEPSALRQTSSRWDKVVVVKGVFTFAELEFEPDYLSEAMSDLLLGSKPFGEVKNITIFDKEEEGTATIRFSNAQSAKACAYAFHGKGYNGRPLQAYIATGEEKFKKSRKINNGEHDEAKRLESYSQFIEQQETADGDAPF